MTEPIENQSDALQTLSNVERLSNLISQNSLNIKDAVVNIHHMANIMIGLEKRIIELEKQIKKD